jgi:DNA-binding NtrC family response regulator
VLPTTDEVVAHPSPTPAPVIAGPIPKKHDRSHVLIVDDESALSATLRTVLESEHDVTACTSASHALELLLGETRVDVIVCDILMPGMSGMDLHRELAEKRPEMAKRILFMSGASCLPGVIEFLASVRSPCVDKPIDVPRLSAMIREISARPR